MDHVAFVGDAEALGNLQPVGQRLGGVEGTDPGDPLFQGFPLDVLEHDVGPALVLARVDHGDHVRVGKLRHRPRFLVETLELIRLLGHLPVHQLHRHRAVQHLVAGEVDRGHAATAELGLKPVPIRKDRPDHL